MHTHGVDVLDRADDHAVVGAVAHDFELVFLPALDRGLNQHLVDRARSEAGLDDALEFRHVVGDASATTTEDVRRADDRRQLHLAQHRFCFFVGVGDAALWHLEADFDHRLLELLAVFGSGNRLCVRTDQLGRAGHADETAFVQCHRQIERSLPAEGRQHCIRLLPLDDRREHVGRQRLDVGAVSEVRVGHDGRRVRVRKNHAIALCAQHAARLRARVVELAGLTNDDWAGADHEDAAEVTAARHR